MNTTELKPMDWDVRACKDLAGNITCYDICSPAELDAPGIAVIASVYAGKNVADDIVLCRIELLGAVDAVLDGPASLNASLKRLRAVRAKIAQTKSVNP
jgi:hypothetical protein